VLRPSVPVFGGFLASHEDVVELGHCTFEGTLQVAHDVAFARGPGHGLLEFLRVGAGRQDGGDLRIIQVTDAA